MKLAIAIVALALVGCGTKFGPGTIVSTDPFEYRQDDNWVYSNGKSQIRALDLAGQHCDSLRIYGDFGWVDSMNGVNCHTKFEIGTTSTLTLRSGECLTAGERGYRSIPCPGASR